MEFTVPQFIEEDTKIIGPLNFKQIMFIGAAVLICVFIYFSIDNFFIFIFLSIIVLTIGVSLALLKVNKTKLPIYIKDFFLFNTKTKLYLWRKESKKTETKYQKRKNN